MALQQCCDSCGLAQKVKDDELIPDGWTRVNINYCLSGFGRSDLHYVLCRECTCKPMTFGELKLELSGYVQPK